MTTSRRGFLTLAGLGALAAALPACSSVLPEPDTGASGFGTSATGRVEVWCRAATQTGLTTLVDTFNASQDRLTVELVPVPDAQYVTKLATAIRGRNVPDLVPGSTSMRPPPTSTHCWPRPAGSPRSAATSAAGPSPATPPARSGSSCSRTSGPPTPI